MIDWLKSNKEWLFSGIGVSILSSVLIFFKGFDGDPEINSSIINDKPPEVISSIVNDRPDEILNWYYQFSDEIERERQFKIRYKNKNIIWRGEIKDIWVYFHNINFITTSFIAEVNLDSRKIKTIIRVGDIPYFNCKIDGIIKGRISLKDCLVGEAEDHI